MKAPPFRIWIAVMIFFSTFTNYMMRANFTVSVYAMNKPLAAKNKSTSNPCNITFVTTSTNKSAEGLQDWTQPQIGQLISMYFYGTMISFFPGGTIAEMLGAVNVIFYTSALTAVLTAITPVAAAGGFWAVAVIRFVIGVLGGPVYPALNVLTAKWAPPNEKGKFLAAFMGNTIGVVVTWLVVGNSSAQWGWEAGYYSVAAIMTVFCILFFFIAAETPQKSKCTSDAEREYIATAQGGTVSAAKAKKLPPYGKIFTSIRFYAVVVAQFGNLWAMNLMLTYAPVYFKETLGFNIKKSVLYAAMPYLARLLTSQVFGILGDYLRKNEILSVTNIRRIFISISHLLPALCFCFIWFTGCHWIAGLVLLVLNQGLNGAIVSGHMINCQDLSPNYAGTLYGIMNWIGSTTGFIVPPITAAITVAHLDDPIKGAAIIFLIGGAVLAGTAIFFIIFCSGEVQPWNEKPKEEGATE